MAAEEFRAVAPTAVLERQLGKRLPRNDPLLVRPSAEMLAENVERTVRVALSEREPRSPVDADTLE